METDLPLPNFDDDLTRALTDARARMNAVRLEIESVLLGQKDVIVQVLTAVLAGGHMLLIGVPGLGKTRLVLAMARVLSLEAKRVQCTPDLMPSDIIGAEVLEEVDYGKRNFRFIPGPVFCQFLMVDEINRASPRTQSALLQAMQERHVTVAGREHALPSPFMVLATQNPIEHEGTYPLPEAQLDRFLMQINIDYPDQPTERMIVMNLSADTEQTPRNLMYANDLKAIQALIRHMQMPEPLLQGILRLVRSGRPSQTTLDLVKKYVAWGPSPRACQALALAARARALIEGRLGPATEDLLALAGPVLRHRMALNYAARGDGISLDQIIEAMVRAAAL